MEVFDNQSRDYDWTVITPRVLPQGVAKKDLFGLYNVNFEIEQIEIWSNQHPQLYSYGG